MVERENLFRPSPELEDEMDGLYTDRQFLEPGADGGPGDDEADMFSEAGFGFGFGDTLSAEEAAMRVVHEPPGMNYDPDPGYLDHGRD